MKKLERYKSLLYIIILLLLVLRVKGDGFIVIPRGPVSPFPLEVVYHKVDVDINGLFSLTKIDQEFYNPSASRLEGYYIFPIPAGAVISDFRMEINGVLTEAELLDADKAKNLYEEIVRKMRDPALLEYGERGLFKVRIFPIEPNSKKKITISYSQVLEKDNGITEYVYPLNTEKFSAKPLETVEIEINLTTEEEIKTLYSPTHNIEIKDRNKRTASLMYRDNNIKPDRDFKLYFSTAVHDIDMSLLTYSESSNEGYFMLSISPPFSRGTRDLLPKDITFVLDNSGSMSGKKLEQAKKALLYCVNNLNEGDRFDIVRFSTEAEALFNGLKEFDESSHKQAAAFIERLKAVGGTNIEDALKLALKPESGSSRPHIVVFITDGKPTIGETDEKQLIDHIIAQNRDKTRIFTFGIGEDINTHLLDKITSLSKAARSYVSPTEDIEVKISSFYDKVQFPVLTDLSLESFSSVELLSYYPKNIPDLFKGSNLILFGKFRGKDKAEIKLRGNLGDKRKEYSITADFGRGKTRYDFIPVLWASRRVGYLLDQIRLNGEDKEIVDEIVQLAKTYGIVTPYTSYLILEDEQTNFVRRDIPEDFRTMDSQLAASPLVNEELREDYDSMSKKSGETSIRSSKEIQNLNQAYNLPQTAQGAGRMNFEYGDEGEINLSRQVQNIQNRAFYRNGSFWVDSRLQYEKPERQKRVQFGTEEYFDLFQKTGLGEFLAAGKNVRFLADKTYYEIFE